MGLFDGKKHKGAHVRGAHAAPSPSVIEKVKKEKKKALADTESAVKAAEERGNESVAADAKASKKAKSPKASKSTKPSASHTSKTSKGSQGGKAASKGAKSATSASAGSKKASKAAKGSKAAQGASGSFGAVDDPFEDHGAFPQSHGFDMSGSYGKAYADAAAPKQPSDPIKVAKRRRRRKRVAVAFACTGGVVLAVYLGGWAFFATHFYPRSSFSKADLSLMNASSARKTLEGLLKDYRLKVKGDGLDVTLDSAQAGLELRDDQAVNEILPGVAAWKWPYELTQTHRLSAAVSKASLDAGSSSELRRTIDEFNKTRKPSENAHIAYDESAGRFRIVPEVYGGAIDFAKLDAALTVALAELRPELVIDQDVLVEPTILKDNKQLKAGMEAADKLLPEKITLVMGTSKPKAYTGRDFAGMIVLNDRFVPALEPSLFDPYLDGLCGELSTKGSKRTYKRADGKQITVQGGSYGWEVDRPLLAQRLSEAVLGGRDATVEVPMSSQAQSYQPGGRDWNNRYVDVDLAEQIARFYGDDGVVIWQSPIVSGRPDASHATPYGVYVVNNMQSPSTLVGAPLPGSSTPEYRTTVRYWMPFVGNAIGFHDAPWQSAFGGDRYRQGFGSHGCVNLPSDAAQALYGLLRKGDVVVVHA